MVGGVVVASPALRGARAVCRRGLQDIGRAGARATGASLGHVALAGGGSAGRAAWLEGVGRTDSAASRAGLGHVAITGGGSADRARVAGWVLAGVARPVALIQRAGIAVGGAGGPGGLLRVGGTVVAHAVAALGEVALPGRGATDGNALRIGWAGRIQPVTGLRRVAHARRSAAKGSRVTRRIAAEARTHGRLDALVHGAGVVVVAISVI